MTKLSEPTPMGYSSSGLVEEVGKYAEDEFQEGDLVACAGHGYACHAELTYVPKTLCVKVPNGVKPEHAAFANIGSIALHSIRLAKPEIGSSIAVIGLGLLGQLAVQIARAAGCSVFGVDIVPEKVELAKKLGAEAGAIVGKEDVEVKAQAFAPKGFDSVVIFASTKSSQPIELAAKIVRERGRIVAPGWVRLKLPRNLFYNKEIDFIVPRSSGPGLYDPKYESGSLDYPYPYVRWTVKRNMETFLHLIKRGDVRIDPLITHIFDFEQAEEIYRKLHKRKLKGAIGVLFKYKAEYKKPEPIIIEIKPSKKLSKGPKKDKVVIGFIGAGQHAQSVLLPILKKMKVVEFKTVCTSRPITATQVAKRWHFQCATTDPNKVIEDPDIDSVFIATRHDTHAFFTSKALEAGKYVFVEKPLAINEEQLNMIVQAWKKNPDKLMVGFNRRYAPFTLKAKELLVERTEPLTLLIRVNTGYTPLDHWIFHPIQGGGRIIGEVCHFLDLAIHLAGSEVVSYHIKNIRKTTHYHFTDNVAITMEHKDGSLSTILYTAMGNRKYPRELVEVYCQQMVICINNFRTMTLKSRITSKTFKRTNSDRGHSNQLKIFINNVLSRNPLPKTFEQDVHVTLLTIYMNNTLAYRKL